MKRKDLEKIYGDISSVPQAKEYLTPQEGFQRAVLMNNTDVMFAGGSAGSGKSISLIFSGLYGAYEPNFRCVFLRNSLKDVKAQGGLFDQSKLFYPEELGTWRETDPAQFTSSAEAIIEYNHLQNQEKMTIERIWKGRQLSLIAFDEISPGIEFQTFQFLLGRNRHPGPCGLKPRIIATCNPSSEHWVRTFIDWYIDESGKINPERDGKIRYFFITGEHVDSVVWGDTKKEVYLQCKQSIDRKMSALRGTGSIDISPNNFIKSFVFIEGKASQNKAMLKDSSADYLGSLANQGDANSAALLEGNWNANTGETVELLSQIDLTKVFYNEPQVNNRWAMTVDVAFKGGDLFVAMVWHGYHMVDIEAYAKDTDTNIIISVINRLKSKYNISESNIVYDADGIGSFMEGTYKRAVAFHTNGSVKNSENYKNIKSQCADKWAERIKRGGYSITPEVASRKFKGKGAKDTQTLREWLIQERRAFRWKSLDSDGKLGLIQKKEMKPLIGRSPDFTESWIQLEVLDLIRPNIVINAEELLNW